MRKIFFLILLLWFFPFFCGAQEEGFSGFSKTFGGKRDDLALSIQETRDGGYIVAGYTKSKGAGGLDIWVLKFDKDGNIK